jgi:hypothetical protein
MRHANICGAAAHAAILLLIPACGFQKTAIPLLAYRPPVTFKGCLNGGWIELVGNKDYPNTCRVIDDTVKLFLCSNDYLPGRFACGRFLRLVIFPFADSCTAISAKQMILHFCDYSEEMSPSYEITPADTASACDRAHLTAESLDRRTGGHIQLANIQVTACPMVRGRHLEIVHGVISGTAE